MVLVMAILSACAMAPAPMSRPDSQGTVVFGRMVAVLMAPSSRTYEPKVGFLEILNRGTEERIQVDVGSNDTVFILNLSAGDYEVARIQIHEGPFLAIADLALKFHVGQEPVAYLGTLRIGVDAPQNDRHLLVSAVQNQADQAMAEQQLLSSHADLIGQPVLSRSPTPSVSDTPLYEVMPYPRVVPYYRRHW